MGTSQNNWHVITGAPSSGKSTIISRLAGLGYETVPEMGRILIDQELAKGKTLEQINIDSIEFEEAWVKLHVQEEAKLNPDEVTFLDRGVLDTLAYFKLYGWPLTEKIKKWCRGAKYKKVFLFELLDYEKDYARIETEATAKRLEDLTRQVYEEAGYKLIIVPKDTVENRLAFVQSHIE